MMKISDEEARQVRAALRYAGRLAHEELNQRGEADAELYEVKAGEAQKKLAHALEIVEAAILASIKDDMRRVRDGT